MKDFKIPELGENISSATVVKVLVKAGDTIELDQPVLELETDKATIEVPSDVSGKIIEIKIKDGDVVTIGQVIFSVEFTEVIAQNAVSTLEETTPIIEPVAELNAGSVDVPQKIATVPTEQEFLLPELGENITTATIIKYSSQWAILLKLTNQCWNSKPIKLPSKFHRLLPEKLQKY